MNCITKLDSAIAQLLDRDTCDMPVSVLPQGSLHSLQYINNTPLVSDARTSPSQSQLSTSTVSPQSLSDITTSANSSSAMSLCTMRGIRMDKDKRYIKITK